MTGLFSRGSDCISLNWRRCKMQYLDTRRKVSHHVHSSRRRTLIVFRCLIISDWAPLRYKVRYTHTHPKTFSVKTPKVPSHRLDSPINKKHLWFLFKNNNRAPSRTKCWQHTHKHTRAILWQQAAECTPSTSHFGFSLDSIRTHMHTHARTRARETHSWAVQTDTLKKIYSVVRAWHL